MIATLMALQAGLPLLDFSTVKRKKKDKYFSAVKEVLSKATKSINMAMYFVSFDPQE